jgi:hypothetical protein
MSTFVRWVRGRVRAWAALGAAGALEDRLEHEARRRGDAEPGVRGPELRERAADQQVDEALAVMCIGGVGRALEQGHYGEAVIDPEAEHLVGRVAVRGEHVERGGEVARRGRARSRGAARDTAECARLGALGDILTEFLFAALPPPPML